MDRRALVLGGGGVTGIAWEIGVIAGLAGRGIDLAAADVIIGTSAGSVVGADITSGQELEALYRAQLAPPDPEPAARIGWGLIGRLAWVVNTSRDPVRARARIGRWALAARVMPEADRRTVFEARLPAGGWPATMLKVTAVDARTGEFVVFDSAGEAWPGGCGRGKLRGAWNLAAGHHRDSSFRRRRRALGSQCRPGGQLPAGGYRGARGPGHRAHHAWPRPASCRAGRGRSPCRARAAGPRGHAGHRAQRA